MRTFELALDGITNEIDLYPDGMVRCSVRDITPGQVKLLWVRHMSELGQESVEKYVAWLKKVGYVEVS